MEVMFAAAIMVTVLIALVYSLTQAANVTQTAHNQDIALIAAQDMLETIANSATIASFHGQTFAVQTQVNNQTVQLLTGPAGRENTPGEVAITWTDVARTPANLPCPPGIPDNLFNVEVTVNWQQRGGIPLSRTLSTTVVK